jgi:excisionase family DNA binding protein
MGGAKIRTNGIEWTVVDLKAAAEQLGVHYQTAYRWVREGSLPAVKIGPAYDVDPRAIEQVSRERSAPVPPPTRSRVRSWVVHVDRLYDALVLGEERSARVAVERLHDGGITTVELCQHLFTPALRRIGESWAKGRVSLADEHRASAICTKLLARISVHPRGRPRGIAVVTTVPGEGHELPGMMASMALRAERWQVHHLGTQVPYDQLASLAKREGARLVVLSVTDMRVQADSDRFAQRVEEELHMRVLVGRPGATLTELQERVGAF